jgi:predicted nucleotidyltransferase
LALRQGYTGRGISVIRSTPLPHDVHQRLATIARALDPFPDVVFAYLFGSLASGRPSPLSDVDVAVYLQEGADFGSRRLEILGALTRHLETDEVDVVVLNSAPIALAGRVLSRRRVILDRRPFVRHQYESLTTREFLDFRHFEHRLLERRFARGGQGPAAPEAR